MKTNCKTQHSFLLTRQHRIVLFPMSDNQKPCFFNGAFVPLSEANINIQTNALHYGTSCFGGLRAYWNAEKNNLYAFRLKDHYQRLTNSSRILQLKMPHSVDELINITVELLQKGKWQQNVYLRPILYKAELDIPPRFHNGKDTFSVYAIGMEDYLDTQNGLKTCVSSWMRIHDNIIPTRAKASGGYANSALAKSEAVQNNFDEAICLNKDGYVSEGSAENIFLVRNNQLITPDLSSDILEGITRQSIIEIAKENNIEVVERKVARTELYVADEVFFTGTGVQVAWVKSIDHRLIGGGSIGKISSLLQNKFFEIVKGQNEKYSHWLTPIYEHDSREHRSH